MENDLIKVTIKEHRRNFTLELSKRNTIYQMKEKIKKELNVKKKQQKLLYKGIL